jgi:hypothetical protein
LSKDKEKKLKSELKAARGKIRELEFYIDKLCNSWSRWELEEARDEAMSYYESMED